MTTVQRTIIGDPYLGDGSGKMDIANGRKYAVVNARVDLRTPWCLPVISNLGYLGTGIAR